MPTMKPKNNPNTDQNNSNTRPLDSFALNGNYDITDVRLLAIAKKCPNLSHLRIRITDEGLSSIVGQVPNLLTLPVRSEGDGKDCSNSKPCP